MLQAQYRDNWSEVADLKRLHEIGKLTEYQQRHWFGIRPVEELYDLEADPHQINNLITSPEYAAELRRHRKILDSWVAETDDRGQYSEGIVQLRATYELWKDRPIFSEADTNPEYEQFRKEPVK